MESGDGQLGLLEIGQAHAARRVAVRLREHADRANLERTGTKEKGQICHKNELGFHVSLQGVKSREVK